MLRFSAILYLSTAAILSAAAAVGAQKPAALKAPAAIVAPGSFGSISRAEVELLLADVAGENPDIIKKLNADPEMKKQQLENLKQLLAFATMAEKEGLGDDPTNRIELANIRSEIIAVNYDREVNKSKTAGMPFSAIGTDRIDAFWVTDPKTTEAAFNDFLETKIKLLMASNAQMAGRQVTDEEKAQARDFYAKIKLAEGSYLAAAAAGKVSPALRAKVDLLVKLQQAQFLARQFSEKLAGRAKVSDSEIDTYIAEHAELNFAGKKAKAANVLVRARAGEDFAKLADEFSDDPGNSGENGRKLGGIYRDVPSGRMIPAFEKAALALEPGIVAADMVETDFGFHIIKLERKGKITGATEDTYDVRHILISTALDDPLLPGRPVPLREHVRKLLEKEKEAKVIDEIVAASNISVPDDFTVPVAKMSSKPIATKRAAPVVRKRTAARGRRSK